MGKFFIDGPLTLEDTPKIPESISMESFTKNIEVIVNEAVQEPNFYTKEEIDVFSEHINSELDYQHKYLVDQMVYTQEQVAIKDLEILNLKENLKEFEIYIDVLQQDFEKSNQNIQKLFDYQEKLSERIIAQSGRISIAIEDIPEVTEIVRIEPHIPNTVYYFMIFNFILTLIAFLM